MEDEFYNLTVKGNDIKTYVRRFQELAVLCPNMVPILRNLWEVSSGDCPKVLKEPLLLQKASNTLEESQATNIAPQRLMDRAIKHSLCKEQ
ncbi:hypothetical protein Tco_0817053 [Tanacetum coccineum]